MNEAQQSHDPPDDVEYAQQRFSPPPGSTQLLLVRHGASAPARPGTTFPLRDGQGDPPLAPEGHEQARLVGARLASEPVDALYVTTLQRTRQTAAPLVEATGLEPRVEPDLREVHLGEWEGGRYREHVANDHPIAREMFEKQRWDVIPGAEPDEEFRGRVVAGIERIRDRHPGQRVVAVVHGGVIAAAVGHAAGVSGWMFAGAENCSIHHLVLVDGLWMLRAYNDVAHLGPLLR